MADLTDRIQYNQIAESEGRSKIPVHQLAAALNEYARGKLTLDQITTAFDLVGDEVVELQTIAGEIDKMLLLDEKLAHCSELLDMWYLTEQPNLGLYDTKASLATRTGT